MIDARSQERITRAVAVLAVISIGWALAHLTWRLVGWDDGRTEVAVAATLPPLAPGGDQDVKAIVALAPFGGGAGSNLSPDGLPASSLGLILKGVLLAFPAEASTALIAPADGQPAMAYAVGQAVVGNAVIEAIEIDRVIINNGGNREVLAFPDLTPNAPGQPAQPGAITPGATPIPAPPAQPQPTAAGQAALAAASPVATAQAQAQAARPAAPANAAPASLSSLGVAAESGGYRVGANPAPELTRAGLRAGDVVAAVNGQAIGPGTDERTLIQRAMQAGNARVDIIRDGRRMTVTVPLR